MIDIGSRSLLTWTDVTDTASDFWNTDSAGLNKEVLETRKIIRRHVKLLCAEQELEYCRADIMRFKDNIKNDAELLKQVANSTQDWIYKSFLSTLAHSISQLTNFTHHSTNYLSRYFSFI